MLFSLECLQYLDVVGMPETLQYIDFIHYLLLLAFLLHEIHIDALYRTELPRQPMQSQVHLPKCSFSKHLANLVQLKLGLRWFLILLEAVSDQLAYQVHLLGSRRQRLGVLLMLLYVLQNVLLIRIQYLTLVSFRVLPSHDFLVVRIGNKLWQINCDNIFQLLVHLSHSWIPTSFLLKHIILSGSLNGAVFR